MFFDRIHRRNACRNNGIHHLLFRYFCGRIAILRYSLEIIGEKAFTLWSRFAGLLSLPGFFICLHPFFPARLMQPPGRQVVNQRLDATDIVPVHVYPQADVNTVFKSQRHIFQNAVVGRHAVPMEPAPVVQFAHTVYRHLQMGKTKFFQQIDIGIQIVAIRDGGR